MSADIVIQNYLILKHEQWALISLITEGTWERIPHQRPRCLKQNVFLLSILRVALSLRDASGMVISWGDTGKACCTCKKGVSKAAVSQVRCLNYNNPFASLNPSTKNHLYLGIKCILHIHCGELHKSSNFQEFANRFSHFIKINGSQQISCN